MSGEAQQLDASNEQIENGKTEDEEIKKRLHTQSLRVLKRLPAVGPVIMLYLQSSHRRFQFISDLEWLLLPPLVQGQCKLYMKKEYPISFISWAFLDEESEKRILQNGGKLRSEDWKSGDRLWVIDIVAPFGGVENMLRDIQKNEFPGRSLKIIAPDPKSGGITTRELPAFNDGEQKQKESEAA